MNVTIVKDYESMSQEAAKIVMDQVKKKPDLIVCFPTGSTPIRMYEILVEENAKGNVDFSNVQVRSVDDYVGLPPEHNQSYAYFLDQLFFSKCNFNPNNIRLIHSCAPDMKEECRHYARMLEEEGGIDLIIDGIGENGHIGFNEPADKLMDRYHVEKVSEWTRKVNARFFESLDEVPKFAVTVGVLDLLEAGMFLILSNGTKKAEAWRRLFHDEYISADFPASLLKLGRNVHCILDEASASLI